LNIIINPPKLVNICG